jgi:hypothetical protein
MTHVALVGDSVFDNLVYVQPGIDVQQQLREALPSFWKVTLCAIDGSITNDVLEQLEELPEGVSHIVVSVGGNDGLQNMPILSEKVSTVAEGLSLLSEVVTEFRSAYREMLEELAATKIPATVCTIYQHLDPPVLQVDVHGLEARQLREPDPGVQHQGDDGDVPGTHRRVVVVGGKESPDLLRKEGFDDVMGNLGRFHILEDVGFRVPLHLEPVEESPQRAHPVVHGGGGRCDAHDAPLLQEEDILPHQLQVHGCQGGTVAVVDEPAQEEVQDLLIPPYGLGRLALRAVVGVVVLNQQRELGTGLVHPAPPGVPCSFHGDTCLPSG